MEGLPKTLGRYLLLLELVQSFPMPVVRRGVSTWLHLWKMPFLSLCWLLLSLLLFLELCQEIGLVALMFFFELLFFYVSLTISLYVFLTNLFSLILFLICQLPETLKMKEKQDLILLVPETV